MQYEQPNIDPTNSTPNRANGYVIKTEEIPSIISALREFVSTKQPTTSFLYDTLSGIPSRMVVATALGKNKNLRDGGEGVLCDFIKNKDGSGYLLFLNPASHVHFFKTSLQEQKNSAVNIGWRITKEQAEASPLIQRLQGNITKDEFAILVAGYIKTGDALNAQNLQDEAIHKRKQDLRDANPEVIKASIENSEEATKLLESYMENVYANDLKPKSKVRSLSNTGEYDPQFSSSKVYPDQKTSAFDFKPDDMEDAKNLLNQIQEVYGKDAFVFTSLLPDPANAVSNWQISLNDPNKDVKDPRIDNPKDFINNRITLEQLMEILEKHPHSLEEFLKTGETPGVKVDKSRFENLQKVKEKYQPVKQEEVKASTMSI